MASIFMVKDDGVKDEGPCACCACPAAACGASVTAGNGKLAILSAFLSSCADSTENEGARLLPQRKQRAVLPGAEGCWPEQIALGDVALVPSFDQGFNATIAKVRVGKIATY